MVWLPFIHVCKIVWLLLIIYFFFSIHSLTFINHDNLDEWKEWMPPVRSCVAAAVHRGLEQGAYINYDPHLSRELLRKQYMYKMF